MDDSRQRLLERALEIAVRAHRGQRDKAGGAYIMHPLRVMMRLDDDTERIVGLLHDVVEDSGDRADPEDRFSLERLRAEGFPETVLQALRLVTKIVDENGKEEDYDDFIKRLQDHPVARRVKMADLQDNMDLTRIENPSPRDYARLEKYQKAYAHLQGIEREHAP